MEEKGLNCTCPAGRTREENIQVILKQMEISGDKDFKEAQENPERYFRDMAF